MAPLALEIVQETVSLRDLLLLTPVKLLTVI